MGRACSVVQHAGGTACRNGCRIGVRECLIVRAVKACDSCPPAHVHGAHAMTLKACVSGFGRAGVWPMAHCLCISVVTTRCGRRRLGERGDDGDDASVTAVMLAMTASVIVCQPRAAGAPNLIHARQLPNHYPHHHFPHSLLCSPTHLCDLQSSYRTSTVASHPFSALHHPTESLHINVSRTGTLRGRGDVAAPSHDLGCRRQLAWARRQRATAGQRMQCLSSSLHQHQWWLRHPRCCCHERFAPRRPPASSRTQTPRWP
jgi:hypothetical protein